MSDEKIIGAGKSEKAEQIMEAFRQLDETIDHLAAMFPQKGGDPKGANPSQLRSFFIETLFDEVGQGKELFRILKAVAAKVEAGAIPEDEALELFQYAFSELPLRYMDLKHPGTFPKISERPQSATACLDEFINEVCEEFKIEFPARVGVTADEAKGEDILPIPWKYWKNRGILFPKKAGPKHKRAIQKIEATGEHAITTAIDAGTKIITHRGFIPADVKEADLPKFGELTEKIYRAAVAFQKNQVRKTNNVAWPHVGKAELLKYLNYSQEEIGRGGRLFDLVDHAFWTLAFFTFEIKDKKSGQVEEIDHILSWRRDQAGSGFYFRLNDDHTRLILHLARGEQLEGRYASLPAWIVRADIEKRRQGIFEGLISMGGLVRPYPVLIKTILKEWAGMKETEIKKMAEDGKLSAFIPPVLTEAIDKGLLKAWEWEKKSTSVPIRKGTDYLNWKIQFFFFNKLRQYAIDADLLAAMMEAWGNALILPAAQVEKKKKQISAVMKKYGPGQIGRLFDQTKAEGEKAFWRELELFKAEQRKAKA